MPSETAEAFCRRVNRAVPLSRTFPGRSDQVAAARQFIRDALAECPGAADVVLLTSELAANAILHSASGDGGSFGVALHQVPALVRVEVTDGGSPAGPTVEARGRLRPSGRGLLLVEELAARWGYRGGPSGRVVWFELECP